MSERLKQFRTFREKMNARIHESRNAALDEVEVLP